MVVLFGVVSIGFLRVFVYLGVGNIALYVYHRWGAVFVAMMGE